MADRARDIIRRSVDGAIMAFLHAHPEVAEGWTRRRPKGKTKAQAVRDSLGKRITGALACDETLARLRPALSGSDEVGEYLAPAEPTRGKDSHPQPR